MCLNLALDSFNFPSLLAAFTSESTPPSVNVFDLRVYCVPVDVFLTSNLPVVFLLSSSSDFATVGKPSSTDLSFLAKGFTPFFGPAFLSATAFFIGSFLSPSLSMSKKSGLVPLAFLTCLMSRTPFLASVSSSILSLSFAMFSPSISLILVLSRSSMTLSF